MAQIIRTGEHDPVVYVIRGAGSFYKIGWTRNLKARVGDLQVGSPIELEVVATGDGGQRLEASIHRQFEHRRHRGEWFSLTDEDLAEVQRRLSGGMVTLVLPTPRRRTERRNGPANKWRYKRCIFCRHQASCRVLNGHWWCTRCVPKGQEKGGLPPL